MVTPGDRLRAARLAAGLTQLELATRLGISKQAVCNLERGRRNPSLDWLVRAAAALGCGPAKLDGRLASKAPR